MLIFIFFIVPSKCCIWDGFKSCLGGPGDLQRGGVRPKLPLLLVSSPSICRGIKDPTSSLSVEPSSTPLPNQRPQGNLIYEGV